MKEKENFNIDIKFGNVKKQLCPNCIYWNKGCKAPLKEISENSYYHGSKDCLFFKKIKYCCEISNRIENIFLYIKSYF